MTKPGAETIRLVRADFRRARLEEVFGAVIVGPASLSILRTLRAQFELLATAANHITANGIVIVETMTSPGEPPSGAAPTRQPGIGLRFPALPEVDLMAHTTGLRLGRATSAAPHSTHSVTRRSAYTAMDRHDRGEQRRPSHRRTTGRRPIAAGQVVLSREVPCNSWANSKHR